MMYDRRPDRACVPGSIRHSVGGVPGSGQETITAERPDLPVIEGVRSLEVRWIFPGQLEAAVARWFDRFPAAPELREDTYFLDPHLRGLSVKFRGGGPLEIKVYRGSPGILDIAGGARGRMESWQKWSFRCNRPGPGSDDPSGWMPVRKRRRVSVFPLACGHDRTGLPGVGKQPGCAVELTEVRMDGKAWWTLGLEATGPASMLRRELEATAVQVFADVPPGGAEFAVGNSRSYAEWLGVRPDAGSVADA